MSSASGSVVESVPTTVPTGRFSAMEFAERVISLGDSLTFATKIVNDFSAKSPPASAERTRIE